MDFGGRARTGVFPTWATVWPSSLLHNAIECTLMRLIWLRRAAGSNRSDVDRHKPYPRVRADAPLR